MALLRKISLRAALLSGILALVAAIFPISAIAVDKTPDFHFTQINTANSSLSYDGITRIMQDSRGFVWIGTFKGLNLYDGTRFTSFDKKQLGLESDFVHTIIEDKEGNLWIGTDTGVSRYIYKEARFEPFMLLSDKGTVVKNKVTSLYCDATGQIWIVANYQGCFRYNPSDGVLVNYKDEDSAAPEYDISHSSISFRRMVEDGEGSFYFSKYHQNIFHADADLKSIKMLKPSNDPDFFKGDDVEQMFMFGGNLLIASRFHGISMYDPATTEVRSLMTIPEGADLMDAFLQQQKWVWLSTTKGVWRYDLEGKDPTIHMVHNPEDRYSVPGDYVNTVFVDRSGAVWVGTKDGGLGMSSTMQDIIHRQYCTRDGERLDAAVVSGFAYDGRGYLWITTENKGIFCYDIDRGNLNLVKTDGLPNTICPPLYDEGYLYFGSLDGLYRMDTATKRVEYLGVLRTSGAVTDPKVYYSYKSGTGELYFSNTLGLCTYNKLSHSLDCIPEFNGVFVTGIAERSDGKMWISSYATGLFEYDPKSRTILRNYRTDDGSNLPSNKLSSVFVDDGGRLWVIGFNNGFGYLTDEGMFTVYNTETLPSLASDVYFSAVQDAAGNLWLTSDMGFVRFNPHTAQASIFSELAGMLDSKMTRAVTKLPSGEIFAGSDNGFVHFMAENLLLSSAPADVVISKMMIGDKAYRGNPDLLKDFVMEQDMNSFGFHFSIMDHPASFSNRIRCCLDGYDAQWRDVTTEKSVYYFNVPAGSYTFRVMSSSDGAQWKDAHEVLYIRIKPPFMASGWGIALMVLASLLLLGAVAALVTLRQRALRKAEEREYRKEAEEDMFRDKMNFFSHVVHEIKTPLTLIQTPLHSVMGKEQLDEDARHDLKVMQSNTNYLTSLVNELLEFVRIERSAYVLNCVPVDLVEMANSLSFNYNDTAKDKNVKLSVSVSQPHIWVSADKAAMGKILNNLLTNALKHASTCVDVNVAMMDGATMKVDVSNDGDRIPAQFAQEVFKPFVQYRQSDKDAGGFGIGLPLAHSLARMHSGDLLLVPDEDKTLFRLILPVIEAPAEDAQSVEGEQEDAQQTASLPTILVVDDNNDMREFMLRKLSADYSIVTAENSAHALQILRDNRVDMIITDITMPGMNGLEFCRAVRADVELSHLPIIVLSARTSVESKIQAMSDGADMYIEKPFDLEYLRSSVKSMIDRRTLMRKAIGAGSGSVDITMFGLPKKDEEFYTRLESIVMENISNSEFSNEMLAEQLCMSVSTMTRKLHKLLDTSPNNYIRGKRLSVAAGLLKDTHGNNITDICYSVGFTNVSYFAKCFKEQYGVTPSEWGASKGGC